ncbi:hypothetical protein [Nonomuraea sp. NEAU-A123]|uniref:hypothetical protein n=1 Tax=Nonomuraea sp. NEAU-A123 TaxID=2839649 RepID=UPI001BE44B8E|nr:hypothetical protein [Nonomuraea sp. NEAU-A123]MBT2229160.1 hypothetical protein [Nonomuraea sp. NEAU-A123]
MTGMNAKPAASREEPGKPIFVGAATLVAGAAAKAEPVARRRTDGTSLFIRSSLMDKVADSDLVVLASARCGGGVPLGWQDITRISPKLGMAGGTPDLPAGQRYFVGSVADFRILSAGWLT